MEVFEAVAQPKRREILRLLAARELSAGETTIAEICKQKNYATACYGKWHLGDHRQFLPMQHGFDEYFGLPYSNDMWPKHPTATFPDLPLVEGEKTIALNPDQTKLDVEPEKAAK